MNTHILGDDVFSTYSSNGVITSTIATTHDRRSSKEEANRSRSESKAKRGSTTASASNMNLTQGLLLSKPGMMMWDQDVQWFKVRVIAYALVYTERFD